MIPMWQPASPLGSRLQASGSTRGRSQEVLTRDRLPGAAPTTSKRYFYLFWPNAIVAQDDLNGSLHLKKNHSFKNAQTSTFSELHSKFNILYPSCFLNSSKLCCSLPFLRYGFPEKPKVHKITVMMNFDLKFSLQKIQKSFLCHLFPRWKRCVSRRWNVPIFCLSDGPEKQYAFQTSCR